MKKSQGSFEAPIKVEAPSDETSVALGVPAAQSMNMGDQVKGFKQLQIPIQAGSKYSGDISLALDLSDINSVPGAMNKVNLSVSPTSIRLSPGQVAHVTVNIAIDTKSPSILSAKMAKLIASDMGAGVSTSVNIPVIVNPIYQVRMYGPRGTATQSWDVNPGAVVSFCAQATGMRVQFINMDTAPATVHSSGAINHQAADMASGQTYEDTPVKPGATIIRADSYAHVGEGSNRSRTFMFNQPCP